MTGAVSAIDRTTSQRTAPPPGSGSDYRIQRGDTLGEIAARHGTDVDTLARLNGITNPNRIIAGQTITVPSGGASHTVARGDTLSAIAARNGTSVDALMRANPEIRNANQIYPGQVVRVPGGGARQQVPVPNVTNSIRTNAQTSAINTPSIAANGVASPGRKSVLAADIADRAATGEASKGKCYAWVKRALQQSGAVPVYLDGVAAKGAGPQLEKYGFRNVLGSPQYNIKSAYDAPKGAVLVYGAAPGATDKNAKYGHIEIRTDTGFSSDFNSTRARTGPPGNGLEGRGRVLIGVYIKPDAGLVPVSAAQSPAAASGAAVPAASTNDLVARLGKVITIGEGNYESYNTGTKGVANDRVGHSYLHPKQGTVTNMTINQIIATESLSGNNTSRMFATGKYQTTIGTLKLAKQAMGLTGNEKYTPELQERVFREFLLQKAGGGKLAAFVNNGVGTVESAQYAAAKEWASIAVPAGYRIGQYNAATKQYESTGPVSNGRMSYYEKPGQNAANTAATRELRDLLVQIQNGR